MSAVHINDHILDLVVIRKYSFSKILKLDISKSLVFWAFSLLSPPTTIAWLYSSPLFLCISLSYLLPGLKSFPKQLSIGNFVANNLNTFILFFAAPAMQLSNPGYIHLFKFTFQFLTTAGAKSQNCTYRYHNRFIISTLCFLNQIIFYEHLPHNSNFKSSTPRAKPLFFHFPTSSILGRRLHSLLHRETSYWNPSILSTYNARSTW